MKSWTHQHPKNTCTDFCHKVQALLFSHEIGAVFVVPQAIYRSLGVMLILNTRAIVSVLLQLPISVWHIQKSVRPINLHIHVCNLYMDLSSTGDPRINVASFGLKFICNGIYATEWAPLFLMSAAIVALESKYDTQKTT